MNGAPANVYIGGNVSAKSYASLAEGLDVSAGVGDTVYLRVGGNVCANGARDAFGVVAGGGDITVHVSGDVVAKSYYAEAYAVQLFGQNGNSFYAGGDVRAVSLYGAGAKAIYERGVADQTVRVGGDVYARTMFGAATGVDVQSYGQSVDVYVGQGVTAKTTTGDATGLSVIAASGTASVHVGGDVDASTSLGNATGISCPVPTPTPMSAAQ